MTKQITDYFDIHKDGGSSSLPAHHEALWGHVPDATRLEEPQHTETPE
jgi:hypothetical protein